MRRFHQVFGVTLLIAFVLTGQYMDKVHGHLRGMADGPRMMYRSRHIYVLMAALLNLALGAYLVRTAAGARRTLQLVGSAVIAAASLSLVVAFFYDAPHAVFGAPQNLEFSRLGIYGVAAGVLMHAAAAAITEKRREAVPLDMSPRLRSGCELSPRSSDATKPLIMRPTS